MSGDPLIQALVEFRESHGVSQSELARRIGVHQASVSQFEAKASNPKMSTVRRYALAVGAYVHHELECAHDGEDCSAP